MAFEQAAIKVENERVFGELTSALERVFAADRITKFLKKLDSRNIRIRDLGKVLTKDAIDEIADARPGTARSLYQALTVSDQAQMREFYLSKLEMVDTDLRLKFKKLFQYY
jgi:hypothetical protein